MTLLRFTANSLGVLNGLFYEVFDTSVLCSYFAFFLELCCVVGKLLCKERVSTIAREGLENRVTYEERCFFPPAGVVVPLEKRKCLLK